MSERRTNYKEWAAKSESNFLCIRNNLASSEIPWDMVCFHAQQIAEKLLKAFLILHQRQARKTHDVVALLTECAQIDQRVGELLDDCRTLLRYAVDSRYPDPLYDPDEQDGRRAVEAMERVRSAMLERLPGVHPETD